VGCACLYGSVSNLARWGAAALSSHWIRIALISVYEAGDHHVGRYRPANYFGMVPPAYALEGTANRKPVVLHNLSELETMNIRVSYEHSLSSAPDEFIVHVPSQLVSDIPANIPRALLPEYIANLIVERSPSIGRIRNLRIL
jgi:hypothetical protein